MTQWPSGGFAEWTEGHTAFLSVVFSWHLSDAYQRAVWYKSLGYRVRAGGPAVTMNSEALVDVAELGGQVDAMPHHNLNATFTSRGCIRKCGFCAVPIIEGTLRELPDSEWTPKPIICDNNLLACSDAHFDRVIDRLQSANIKQIDFNQGLDARLLTEHHAARIAELDLFAVRLAFDSMRYEDEFLQAFDTLKRAGIPARKIRVYVLFGFDDDPEDARYRLEKVRSLGTQPNPMRFQPLDAVRRNEYIAPKWTDYECRRYMRYWSRLRYFAQIPFSEFVVPQP